ncbi:hypothetical protein [Burkholderia territorii]|uniref:hypothetical protein n=1 Tax=Burkholderia territorii TaxID=1503055 RepID=UPI0012DAABCC|nr:hypothetical protein [Burkholderia territorii]
MSPTTSDVELKENSTPRQAAQQGLAFLAEHFSILEDPDAVPDITATRHYLDLSNASIGYGFQVNLLDPQAILAGKSIAASVLPNGEWCFISMLDNRPVGLITVVKVKDEWTMVTVNASALTREIMAVMSRVSGFPCSRQVE